MYFFKYILACRSQRFTLSQTSFTHLIGDFISFLISCNFHIPTLLIFSSSFTSTHTKLNIDIFVNPIKQKNMVVYQLVLTNARYDQTSKKLDHFKMSFSENFLVKTFTPKPCTI
jgi:hypothetical protein